MQVSEKIKLLDETLWLSTERCIFWQEQKTLIVSDLHFGKTGHFRKSGIPVTTKVYKEDIHRLVSQIQYFKPERLIVVGDFFHSVANKELDYFIRWRKDFSQLQFRLVKGNHDILHKQWYSEADIVVDDPNLHIGNFCFVHDIKDVCENTTAVTYYFSGHVHPCITIKGLARQSLSLPCFYFSESFAILPSFSKFTGGASISIKNTDKVFAIVPGNPVNKQYGAIVKM